MIPYRIIALPTQIAEEVRTIGKAPRYGHPAITEVAKGYGPCRHCLRTFAVGVERRTLFTYDSFDGVEVLPLPGPVFIHTEACERYPEEGRFPADLRSLPHTLNGYGRGRRLLAQQYVKNDTVEAVIERLFARPDIDYIQVHDTEAGCYDFRIERP